MRIANELTTQCVNRSEIEGQFETEEMPKSEILIDGKPMGKFVSGAFLEAAVRWENFYLLFMTDDIPFEEMLGIILLDNQLNELDSAHIGWMYSTGSFSSLSLSESNIVSFRFIGDITWSVELFSQPKLRIPIVSEPTGVWRSFGFSRHFRVHEKPDEEKETV